jgi:tetratricopeptide (TPR) repeat protein
MLESVVLLGPAAEALNWCLNALAESDGDATLGENVNKIASKLAGSIAMGLLGDAAKGKVADALAARNLRPDVEPADRHIEQAYRLAELGALVVFLNRAAKHAALAADPYGGSTAERVSQRLSGDYRAVRADGKLAYAQGLGTEHLAAALSSMTQADWAGSDARTQELRRRIEERALEDLAWATGVPASPAFDAAFRSGLGPELPPWFGVLAHTFVGVLLSKGKKPAQESLMLRLLARVAMNVQPGVDGEALERFLQTQAREQAQRGHQLEGMLVRALGGLGDDLGSSQLQVRAELQTVADNVQGFRQAWEAGQAQLGRTLQRVEETLELQHAKIDRVLALTEELWRRGQASRAVAVAPATGALAAPWAGLALGELPPAEGPPIGRDAEIELVARFLAHPQQRLLKVVGRGGAGKTTLVSHALATALAQGRARPLIYQKATEANRQLLPPVLEAFDRLLVALGVAPVAADLQLPTLALKLDAIARVLAQAEARPLVVLDSLERVIDPASGRLADSDLEQFLLHCLQRDGAIQLILATQALPAVGDRGAVLPLVAVAFERQAEIALGAGIDAPSDGLRLLRSYLAHTRDDLRGLADEPLRALCAEVGGNPGAIKHVAIALASDRWLTPQALLQSLQGQGADTAALGVRDALIGRYFPELAPPQQAFLQALAVLGGSAPLAAVAAVAGFGEQTAPAPLAAALLERYLLRRAGDDCTIHDSEKSFYLSTLAAAQRTRLYGRAAAHWHAQGMPPARWQGYADAAAAVREIEMLLLAEQAGAAAALRQRAAQRLYEIGHVLSAARLLSGAAAAERNAGVATERLALLATCEWKIGAYEQAQRRCADGLALAAALGLEPTRPEVLALRQVDAACHFELGDVARAVADYEQLLADLDALAAPAREAVLGLRARAHVDLCFALSVAGHQDGAVEHGRRAQVLLQAPAGGGGRTPGSVLAMSYLGLVLSYRGDFAAARQLYQDAARLARSLGAPYEQAITLGHFAEFELIEGRTDLSLDLATRALQAHAETGAISGSWCHFLIALGFALDPDRQAEAERHAREACRYTRLLNDPNPRVLLGVLLLRRQQRVEAVGHLEQALDVVDRLVAACPTNWEALVARGLALLALATMSRAPVAAALAAYRAARDASPHEGHYARIALQLRVAEPVLRPAGIDVAAAVRQLYEPAAGA